MNYIDRRTFRAGIVLCIALCTSVLGHPEVEVIDFGLYSGGDRVSTNVVDGVTTHSISNLVLVAKSHKVTASIGNSIGFRYNIRSNDPLPEVFMHVIHPPSEIKHPDTGQVFAPFAGGLTDYPTNNLIVYSFDSEWECVPGEWVFLVGTKQRSLARVAIWVDFKKNAVPNRTMQATSL